MWTMEPMAQMLLMGAGPHGTVTGRLVLRPVGEVSSIREEDVTIPGRNH